MPAELGQHGGLKGTGRGQRGGTVAFWGGGCSQGWVDEVWAQIQQLCQIQVSVSGQLGAASCSSASEDCALTHIFCCCFLKNLF